MFHDRPCLPVMLGLILDVHTLKELAEHVKYFVGPPVFDEVYWTSAIEKPLSREQPHPCLIRLV